MTATVSAPAAGSCGAPAGDTDGRGGDRELAMHAVMPRLPGALLIYVSPVLNRGTSSADTHLVLWNLAKLDVERPRPVAAAAYHGAIVTPTAAGWTAKSMADLRFARLARRPEAAAPQWPMAKGVVRAGGLTIGLLKDNKWAVQMNITERGAFGVALPVRESGPYVAVVANCLPANALQTDVDVTSLGWATSK